MAVSPCTALCSAYARPSPRHASTWSVRRATGAQRLSSAGTLVRVLAPPVKAGISQGRQARRATASYHAICGARYSVPHRVSTLYVQASPRHVSDSIASANIGRKVTRLYSRATYVSTSPLAPCYPSAGRSCLGLSGLQASCRLGSRHPLLLVQCLHRVGGHACARLTTFTITGLSTASEVGGLVVSSAARPHARRPKPGA
jgi:hypothetical protein